MMASVLRLKFFKKEKCFLSRTLLFAFQIFICTNVFASWNVITRLKGSLKNKCQAYFDLQASRDADFYQPRMFQKIQTLIARDAKINLDWFFKQFENGIIPNLNNKYELEIYKMYIYSRVHGFGHPIPMISSNSPTHKVFKSAEVTVSLSLSEKFATLSDQWIQNLLNARDQLINIESHLDYWFFITDITTHRKQPLSSKERSQALLQLNSYIPAETRAKIQDTALSEQERSTLLIQSLLDIRSRLEQQEKVLDFIHQAILNAISLAGFSADPEIHKNLKSSKAEDRVKAIYDLFSLRDLSAQKFLDQTDFSKALEFFPTREQSVLALDRNLIYEIDAINAEKSFVISKKFTVQHLLPFEQLSFNQPTTYFLVTDSSGTSLGLAHVHLEPQILDVVFVSGSYVMLSSEIQKAVTLIIQDHPLYAKFKTNPFLSDAKNLKIVLKKPAPLRRLPALGKKLELLVEELKKQALVSEFKTESEKLQYLELSMYYINEASLKLEDFIRVTNRWLLDPSISKNLKFEILKNRVTSRLGSKGSYLISKPLFDIISNLSPEEAEQFFTEFGRYIHAQAFRFSFLKRYKSQLEIEKFLPAIETSSLIQDYLLLQSQQPSELEKLAPFYVAFLKPKIRQKLDLESAQIAEGLLLDVKKSFLENLKYFLANASYSIDMRAQVASWWITADSWKHWSVKDMDTFLSATASGQAVKAQLLKRRTPYPDSKKNQKSSSGQERWFPL